MRWFTRDFISGDLSDDEWERRRVDYEAHVERIAPDLADGADELLAVSLHDGQVAAWSVEPTGVVEFVVLVGDLQRGYEWATLRYLEAGLVGAVAADLVRWGVDTSAEIIEEEIDVLAPSGYEHRLLLSPDGEFGVRFRSVDVTRRPAVASDRR